MLGKIKKEKKKKKKKKKKKREIKIIKEYNQNLFKNINKLIKNIYSSGRILGYHLIHLLKYLMYISGFNVDLFLFKM